MSHIVNEEILRNGADFFELFWLRPKRYMNMEVAMRLRINNKWGGWKIKDELIQSLGLEVGDTISTEVTSYFSSGRIDDNDDTDLFASGAAADWLIENNVSMGTIIDCIVRFSYSMAPVGFNNKEIYKISLILKEGIRVVGTDSDYVEAQKHVSTDYVGDILAQLRKR